MKGDRPMPRSLVVIAAMLCGLAAGSASATEASAKFSFKPLAVEGLVLRDRVVVGPGLLPKSTGSRWRRRFTFKAPRVDGLLRVAKFPAELGQAYIKIVYGSTDEQFMESIQFNPFALEHRADRAAPASARLISGKHRLGANHRWPGRAQDRRSAWPEDRRLRGRRADRPLCRHQGQRQRHGAGARRGA